MEQSKRYILLTKEELHKLNNLCFQALVTIPPSPKGTTRYLASGLEYITLNKDIENLALINEEVKNIIDKERYSFQDLFDMGKITIEE